MCILTITLFVWVVSGILSWIYEAVGWEHNSGKKLWPLDNSGTPLYKHLLGGPIALFASIIYIL